MDIVVFVIRDFVFRMSLSGVWMVLRCFLGDPASMIIFMDTACYPGLPILFDR